MKQLLFFIFVFAGFWVNAQEPVVVITSDSVVKATPKDSLVSIKKKHNPGKAALRSALVPGLGQIYNKKYWKLPIVYGALGFTGYVFVDNLKWYNRCQYAYGVINDPMATQSQKDQVHPQLQTLNADRLAFYRNQFRANLDLSALWFLIFWGLNVADAAVDAHLMEFDVSDDLSLQLKPVTSGSYAGIGLVLNIGKSK
jgi:hypothetical protein